MTTSTDRRFQVTYTQNCDDRVFTHTNLRATSPEKALENTCTATWGAGGVSLRRLDCYRFEVALPSGTILGIAEVTELGIWV